jgi:hypothetical protein
MGNPAETDHRVQARQHGRAASLHCADDRLSANPLDAAAIAEPDGSFVPAVAGFGRHFD